MNRAREVLTGPAYERMWGHARNALERNGFRLEGSFSLQHPSDAERAAVVALLGGRRRAAGAQRVTIRLAALDDALRGGPLEVGLVEWLETIGEPLVSRPVAREADRVQRQALWSMAAEHELSSESWFDEWVRELRRDGLLHKLARETPSRLLADGLLVLDRLPAGDVSLPVFSASVFGDPKALVDSPVATIVERALATRAGVERPHRARERRELWRQFGVIWDDLASQVLSLNLAGVGDDPVSAWLADACRTGEPIRLTLRQLLGPSLAVQPSRIHVCENPAVIVEAANHLGPTSKPIVCTEGQPSAAFHRLISRAVEQGSEVAYHGDFDWPGLRIAGGVLGRYGGTPWRMGAADYLDAITEGSTFVPLSGMPAESPWDHALAAAMSEVGAVVYEEQVIDGLLGDLDGAR